MISGKSSLLNKLPLKISRPTTGCTVYNCLEAIDILKCNEVATLEVPTYFAPNYILTVLGSIPLKLLTTYILFAYGLQA